MTGPSIRTARQRAKIIAERLAEGKTTNAISDELGCSPRRVRSIMRRFSIPSHKPNTFRFAFHTPRRRALVIKALADSAGVAPSTMIDRIVSTVVDDGMEIAARRLGKLALPQGGASQ